MNTPDDIRYLASHQWGRLEADGTVTVGITDYAQEQLGDVVFVDLPEVGKTLAQGDVAGVIESVKAAADVYMPLSGTIVEVNEALRADPALANSDPMGAGWLFKVCISKPEECEALMDAPTYDAFSQNA